MEDRGASFISRQGHSGRYDSGGGGGGGAPGSITVTQHSVFHIRVELLEPPRDLRGQRLFQLELSESESELLMFEKLSRCRESPALVHATNNHKYPVCY